MTDEKTFDKIKKLLALGGSPNPHEASAAMAMAQKLMAAHGISALNVEMAQIGHVKIKSPFSVSKPKSYETTLAWQVARAFGCRVMWQANKAFAVNKEGKRDDLGRFVFYGAKSQLQVCEHFFILLQRRLLSGRAEFVKKLPKGFNRKQITVEGDGWCNGYVNAIRGALMTVASDAKPEALEAYAKSVLNSGENVKIDRRESGRLGYANGDAAGRAEKLHKPMTTSSLAQIGG